MTTKPEVCGTCGSDTPHLLLKSCAFAHDIPGSGMPDAFHAKPAERLGRCGTCGERGPCRHDAKPADATGEMSEADIRRLASKHLSGLGVFDGPNEVQPQVYASSRALLAEMGERMILAIEDGIRDIIAEAGPLDPGPMKERLLGVEEACREDIEEIRRLMGVKP